MPKLIQQKLPKLIKTTFMAICNNDFPKEEVTGVHYRGFPFLVLHKRLDCDRWAISHPLSGLKIWSYDKRKQALEILWEINQIKIPWSASGKGIESYGRRHPEEILSLKGICKRYEARR